MTTTAVYEVVVELKKEVLDPQGRAIKETLQRVGVKGVEDVKISKRFVLSIDAAKSSEGAENTIEHIAREYLANPVSETFSIKQIK